MPKYTKGGMIPPGFAHGFKALEDSVVVYFITCNEYSPPHERYVHYSYVGWPIKEVILSDKNQLCPLPREGRGLRMTIVLRVAKAGG